MSDEGVQEAGTVLHLPEPGTDDHGELIVGCPGHASVVHSMVSLRLVTEWACSDFLWLCGVGLVRTVGAQGGAGWVAEATLFPARDRGRSQRSTSPGVKSCTLAQAGL